MYRFIVKRDPMMTKAMDNLQVWEDYEIDETQSFDASSTTEDATEDATGDVTEGREQTSQEQG